MFYNRTESSQTCSADPVSSNELTLVNPQPQQAVSINSSQRKSYSGSFSHCICPKKDQYKKAYKKPPPIAVYWDIENCHVPKGKSASSVVRRVREAFFSNHRQTDFMVACDVFKENLTIISDLHQAQVTVIHVSSSNKNAADEKLRQYIRHFGETYDPPCTLLLISGDVDFATDISDLRYRKKVYIILLHNVNASKTLLHCANETYLFSDLMSDLPVLKLEPVLSADIYISNLPNTYDRTQLKNRLSCLSENCGGRVIYVDPHVGQAIIRFASEVIATRAQRRLNGEDVYGYKIVASGGSQSILGAKTQGRKTPKCMDGNPPTQPARSWPALGSSRSDWRSPLLEPTSNPNCDRPRQVTSNYVELIISNLDVAVRDLRTVLFNQLKQYAKVQSVSVNYQDSKPTAIVRVATQQDAEFVISKMHRQKIGYRRINISYARPKACNEAEVRERVVYLLRETPTKSIPLYLLLHTLETQYLMPVPLQMINSLRDVCEVIDHHGERLVKLNTEMIAIAPGSIQKPQEAHYCPVHCPNGITDVTLWQPDIYQLPCINMPLKVFAQKLNALLTSHMGTLPLMSFTICYGQEFGEPLILDSINGVALEHLVTCVKSVALKYESDKNKAKYIVWESSKPEEPEHYSNSPLAISVSSLRREFIDLLRSEPKTQIPLGKIVPAYHHHFGRQLRVADYGYTKLNDLLQSPHLSNVVQIMGEASNRILTLTHSAQMRRFTSDILRILKSRLSKKLTLAEFNEAYQRVFTKVFNAYDYGVCGVEDLLEEIPENLLLLKRCENDLTISIPQRVRTADEIMRTKQFADEVVKLLSHSPNNSMPFDKFVPHYHHHFGIQCKVSHYGFTKLIEVFEAIPETVTVDELSTYQRRISLTPERSLNLLGNRILDLIRKSHVNYLPLEQLMQVYMHEYKAPLNLQLYNCTNTNDLTDKLSGYVTISYINGSPVLVADQTNSSLALRVWSLLVTPPHHCEASKLVMSYYLRFHSSVTIAHLEKLNNIIITRSSSTDFSVFLVPEYAKAAKLYHLLISLGGEMLFSDLQAWHQREFGEDLLQTENSVYDKVLNLYSFLIVISRCCKKTTVSLNPKLADLKLPLTQEDQVSDLSSSCWSNGSSTIGNTWYERTSSPRPAPPKPDTPPSSSKSLLPWQQLLSPSADMDFSIHLPTPDTPKFVPNFNSLISPAKNLLPAHPMGTMISFFPNAPDASEVPLPDKLLKSGSEDSADSGLNNSQFGCENDMDASPNLGAKPKYGRVNLDFAFSM